MRSTADYLAKIPPLNANKPNFRATIAATVSTFADMQVFFAQLSPAFDLDRAVGVQLDVDGQWIGRSRIIPVAIDRPWFSWDIEHFGWNEGYWKSPAFFGDRLQALDDDTYRRLLRAKILANYGDGSVPAAQAALSSYFLPPSLIFVSDRTQAVPWENLFIWDKPLHGWDEGYWESELSIDRLWMHWTVGLSGKIPNKVDLAILAQTLIPVYPAAVAVDVYVTTIDENALFGWDVENEYVSGWDVGAWGASPDYVAQNIALVSINIDRLISSLPNVQQGDPVPSPGVPFIDSSGFVVVSQPSAAIPNPTQKTYINNLFASLPRGGTVPSAGLAFFNTSGFLVISQSSLPASNPELLSLTTSLIASIDNVQWGDAVPGPGNVFVNASGFVALSI